MMFHRTTGCHCVKKWFCRKSPREYDLIADAAGWLLVWLENRNGCSLLGEGSREEETPMKRFAIFCTVGLGILFAALAPTFTPTPASAYYYHHRYYP